MANQTTVKDILIEVKSILNNISIPASILTEESIPVVNAYKSPIDQAVYGLEVCIKAIERGEKELEEKREKEQDESSEDGPEIEVVEVGEISEAEDTENGN